ncbi:MULTISPECIES: hypothetical protein [Streptomyces]|uniref:hypothetical protein n=1 Tax=Streptomyces TaxID=1883 RepID=UPI002DDAF580|nr:MULTISPECIES: hypothetical protein [unclassified Streptomyces]WSE00857.1 hypothetical protein OG758_45870 [Streptomyces sp. NBC_01474]
MTSITRDGDESDDALSDLTDALPGNEDEGPDGDADDDAEASLVETVRAYFE